MEDDDWVFHKDSSDNSNNSSEHITQHGFEEKKPYTAKDISEFVGKHANAATKTVWKAIEKTAEALGVKVNFISDAEYFKSHPKNSNGAYKNGEITIRSGIFGNPAKAAYVMTHEAVHGVTSHIINAVKKGDKAALAKLSEKQIKAAQTLSKLLEYAKAKGHLKGEYGITDEHELLAELSNPDFVKKLQGANKGVVDRIVNWVMDMIGIPQTDYDKARKVLKDMLTTPKRIERNKGQNDLVTFSKKLQAVNAVFNEQLQQLKDGTLPKGHIFELGNAGKILQSAGIPDLPIELSATKLNEKSEQKEHPFDLSNVENLTKAIQNPLAVFNSSTQIGRKVIFTELQQGDKNFVVALELNYNKGNIEVNDIRSIYPRNNSQIVRSISNNESVYINKEKVSEWIGRQRFNSAEATKLSDTATKIINNFENPISDTDVNEVQWHISNVGEGISFHQKSLQSPFIVKDINGTHNVIDLQNNPDVERFIFNSNPTPQDIKDFQKWLRENKESYVRLYHGTAKENDIENKGILKTSQSRRKSYQSQSGYVYLSLFPDSARTFGEMNNYGETTVYAVDVKIKDLLADTDQLNNKRIWGGSNEIGNSLAESLIYGNGARVKRNIQPYELSSTQFSLLNPSVFNADGTVKESVLKEIEAERKDIVEQAKANGTYMKAPNGKATNLNEEQWVATRTKRFKDWFGDWETQAESKAVAEKIDRLLSGSSDTSKGVQRETIGMVTEQQAKVIKDALGIDVSGFKHTIDKSEINHTIKNHGNEKQEASRGQIAINDADFKKIPEVLENPDKIEYSGKNEKGLETIKYTKAFNGTTIIVEEVRSGKRELAFNTMYKHKTGSDSLPKPSVLTPEATSRSKDTNNTEVSKVVDENGEPMVVYHGTNAEFTEFAKDKIWSNKVKPTYTAPDGFYFAKDKSLAEKYGKNVVPVFIGKGEVQLNNSKIIVIENPTQIKSATGNAGTFSNDTGDIRFQKDNNAPNNRKTFTKEAFNAFVQAWTKAMGVAGKVVTDAKTLTKVLGKDPKSVLFHEQWRAINDRFNAELDAFKNKTHKGLLHLGVPLNILKASGVNAKEITLSQKVLADHLEKHGLKEEDLKDLAIAIQKPMFVYQHGITHPNIVVVTEMEVSGKKLAVALKIDKNGNVTQVNNVTSVHKKDAAIELNRLSTANDNKVSFDFKWIENKQDALNWLGIVSLNGSSHTANPKHLALAKVINNHQNPKVDTAELQEDELYYGQNERHEALDVVNDLLEKGEDNARTIVEKVIEKLTGKNGGRATSKYHWTGKKINGKDVVVRVSNHPHAERNANDNEYLISIIVGSERGTSISDEYSEFRIKDSIHNLDDRLFDVLNRINDILHEVDFLRTADGTIFGATYINPETGKREYYVNPEHLNPETLIHETYHPFDSMMSEAAISGDAHAKAAITALDKLAKEHGYLERVQNNKSYAGKPIAEQQAEARTQMVGEVGNAQLDKSFYNKLKTAVSDAIQWIANKFGVSLKGYTPEQVLNLKLNDLAKASLGSMRKGEFGKNIDFQQSTTPFKDITKKAYEALVKKLQKQYDFLFEGKAVVNLTGKEFSQQAGKPLRTQVLDFFNSFGNKVKSVFGEVLLDQKAIITDLEHGNYREKAAAFKAIPEILKNGVEIKEWGQHHKGETTESGMIAAPIVIDGKEYIGVVTVRGSKNRMYVHDVYLKEKVLADSRNSGNSNPTTATSANTDSSNQGKSSPAISKDAAKVLNDIVTAKNNPLQLMAAMPNSKEDVAEESKIYLYGDNGKNGNFTEQNTTDGISYLSEHGGDYGHGSIADTNDLQWGGSADNSKYLSVRAVWNKIKHLSFTGGAKVKSHADVAHIMRLLENKSVEHSFAVHVDKNGNPHIQFLGIGGVTETLIDMRTILNGVKKFTSEKVYLVHNHPTGNMTPSKADLSITAKGRAALGVLDVQVEHIIMDTYKKEYVHINNENDHTVYTRSDIPVSKKFQTHVMDEQEMLSKPMGKIRMAKDAVTAIQQFRFSALPKNAMLLLNNAGEIVGNYVFTGEINAKEAMTFVGDAVTVTSVIFYGNNDSGSAVKLAKEQLNSADISVLDYVILNETSPEVDGFYKSYAELGLLNEVQVKYGTNGNLKNNGKSDVKFSRGERKSDPLTAKEKIKHIAKLIGKGLAKSVTIDEAKMQADMEQRFGKDFAAAYEKNARIASQVAKASQFIKDVLDGKITDGKASIEIPESANRAAEKVLGHKINSHRIKADEVRHINNMHGIDGEKLQKNSIPLTKEDIALAPYIMGAPDRVVKGNPTAKGAESVRYYKDLENGYVVVVEREVSAGNTNMENVTMWAEKSRSTNDESATPKRPSSYTSETSISQSDRTKIRKDFENATNPLRMMSDGYDYRMKHTAPTGKDDVSVSIDRLDEIYPKNVYSDMGWHYYGDGNRAIDKKSHNILQSLKGKPDKMVTVYRAVPKGVKDINSGDWVTVNRDYAVEHGESHLDGEYDIISKTLPANKVFTDANSLSEQGVQFLRTPQGEVKGYVTPDGHVFIDPKFVDSNTPVHEFGHLWNTHIKENNPELWAKGRELVKGSPEWDRIKNSKEYAHLKGDENKIADEVLATLYGEEGQNRLAGKDKGLLQNIKDWVAEVWNDLKQVFGKGNPDILKMTPEQISKLSLEEFIGKAVDNITDGKRVKSSGQQEADSDFFADDDIRYQIDSDQDNDNKLPKLKDGERYKAVETRAFLSNNLDNDVRQMLEDNGWKYKQQNQEEASVLDFLLLVGVSTNLKEKNSWSLKTQPFSKNINTIETFSIKNKDIFVPLYCSPFLK